MKIIKVEGISDKFVAYYLSKYAIPFQRLTLKKNRGRDNYTMSNCKIKKQIGMIENERNFFLLLTNILIHLLKLPVTIKTNLTKIAISSNLTELISSTSLLVQNACCRHKK